MYYPRKNVYGHLRRTKGKTIVGFRSNKRTWIDWSQKLGNGRYVAVPACATKGKD